MSRFLYPIRKLKVKPWIKYWLIKRTAGVLSEVLENLTSPITLTNSLRRKFKIFEVGGKSEQESYQGTNMLVPSQNEGYTLTKNGITVTVLEDGEIRLVGTATALTSFELYRINLVQGTNYYANIFNDLFGSEGIYLQLISSDYNTLYKNFFNSTSPYESTVTDASTRCYVYIANGVTINTTIKPMIKIGSEATEYEPYVGGQPAPNPDYECPISNITGNVNIKVTDVRLQLNEVKQGLYSIVNNGRYEEDNTYVCSKDYIEVTGGEKILVTSIEEKVGTYFILEYDVNKNYLGYKRSNSNITEYSIALRNNTKYILIDLGNGAAPCTPTNTGDFKVYISTEEQTVTFPLAEGQILHEGDTIEDKIVQRRVTKKINEFDWSITANKEYFYTNVANIKQVSTAGVKFAGLCSHYQLASSGNDLVWKNDRPSGRIGRRQTTNYLCIKDTRYTTVSELIEAMGETVVEYELETPIEISFTQAQATAKAQIDKLCSYKGTTYISSNNEPSPTFTIQYVKEE